MKEETTLKNSDFYVPVDTHVHSSAFSVDWDKLECLVIIYKNKKYAVDIEKALSLLGMEVK